MYSSKKRKLNKVIVESLSVGDKVKVKKTGEVGIVKGFVVYGTGQDGEIYDYTSVAVTFDNSYPPRKRNRRFSGSSLIKL